MAFFNNLPSGNGARESRTSAQGKESSRQQVVLKRAAGRKVRCVPASLLLAGHFRAQVFIAGVHL